MATTLSRVEQLYVGYFGRAGDPAGVQFWQNQIGSGAMSFLDVAASFSVQPEAVARYPSLATPSIDDIGSFVSTLYQNLYSRPAEAEGLAFWTAQLSVRHSNPSAIGAMILNIISGATGADLMAVNAKAAVAADFTTQVTNAGLNWTGAVQAQSQIELVPVVDATTQNAAIAQTTAMTATATGQGLVFTTNTDTLTTSSANANFKAPSGTLQDNDSAVDTAPYGSNGNGGSLTATLNGGGNIILKNIPSVTMTNVAPSANVAITGSLTGITTITILDSLDNTTTNFGAQGNGIDQGGVAGTPGVFSTLLNTVNIINSQTSRFAVFVNAPALSGAADAVTVNISGYFGSASNAGKVMLSSDVVPFGGENNAYETETLTANYSTYVQLSGGGHRSH
jgi:hypothetical protein